MEPVSITIITYVSLKFIDQFIKEEGYGRLKKLFFPSTKYKNKLSQLIYESIDEYEKAYPIATNYNKFPFYHSQILFDYLNKYILFKNSDVDFDAIIETLKDNPNIIVPTEKELEVFYQIFTSKIKADKTLKTLFIDENFKSKIFDLSKDLERIEGKVDVITSKVQDLYFELMSFQTLKL
jgi:hypothetical protein